MRSRQRRILILNPDFIDFLKSINNSVSWPTDETSGDVLLASNPAVPAQSILASSVYPGAEVLSTDGDGTCDKDNYFSGDSATLTNPLTNVLRVTDTGVNSNIYAIQRLFELGGHYIVKGDTRGDGTNFPKFYDGALKTIGTTSTDWQPFELEIVVTSTDGPRFYSSDGNVGSYVEFQNLTVKEANPLNADVTGAAITPTSGVSFPYARTYNGTTTYTNIYSAELNSVLDPTDFSFGIFIQKDTWDTTERDFFSLDVDANNYIRCTDTTTAGTIQYEIKAGGISETIPHLTGSPTGWFYVDLTVTGGNLIASFNGAVVGTPQSVAGTFTGNLTSAVIGARTTTPTFVHLGDLSVPYMGMLRSFTQKEKLTIAQKAGAV